MGDWDNWSGNGAGLDAWPVETSRRMPHDATRRHIPRDIRNYKITTGVALNTVLGKDDKSLLAY